jgi:hypothetical protein
MRRTALILVSLMMLWAPARGVAAPNPAHFTIKDGVAYFFTPTDEDLAVLEEHPELTSLTIEADANGMRRLGEPVPTAPVTDAGLAHIATCTKLVRLQLSSGRPLRVTDDGLKQLAGLTELRVLGLGQTQFTDAGIAHLAALTKLEELWLDFQYQLKDGSLATAGRMKSLRVLRFYGAQLTDDGLAQIKDLQNLEDLQLGRSKVTDAGLKRSRNSPVCTRSTFSTH